MLVSENRASRSLSTPGRRFSEKKNVRFAESDWLAAPLRGVPGIRRFVAHATHPQLTVKVYADPYEA